MLKKVANKAAASGVNVAIGQRNSSGPDSDQFTHLKSNQQAQEALAGGSLNVVGAVD